MTAVAYFNSVQDMLGIGLEILVDQQTGLVMAKFYNGSLSCISSSTLSKPDATQGCVATVIVQDEAA